MRLRIFSSRGPRLRERLACRRRRSAPSGRNREGSAVSPTEMLRRMTKGQSTPVLQARFGHGSGALSSKALQVRLRRCHTRILPIAYRALAVPLRFSGWVEIACRAARMLGEAVLREFQPRRFTTSRDRARDNRPPPAWRCFASLFQLSCASIDSK